MSLRMHTLELRKYINNEAMKSGFVFHGPFTVQFTIYLHVHALKRNLLHRSYEMGSGP